MCSIRIITHKNPSIADDTVKSGLGVDIEALYFELENGLDI